MVEPPARPPGDERAGRPPHAPLPPPIAPAAPGLRAPYVAGATGLLADVPRIRAMVERRFPVYDQQADEHVAAFYVTVDATTVEDNFNRLKEDLKGESMIPLLKYQGGEHSVFVIKKPERAFRSTKVNLVLFVLTWITTTIAGSSAYTYYKDGGLDTTKVSSLEFLKMSFEPLNLLGGFVFFALPLMLILGIHEMGHYVLSRKHNVDASLPFFIPVPPFIGGPDIGTLGAFISMREPIPNRKALLDIGAAGPVAGFVVAIPVLLVGMFLMQASPVHAQSEETTYLLGTPLLYDLLAMPFGFSDDQVIHPTAFAGWVGLFVTAINLLPAGQLDGGHIAAAIFGEKSRYLSYAAVAVLLILGFGLPQIGIAGYTGWFVFALLIAFLGIAHPPTLNGVSGLDTKRVVFGAATFALIALCFTPVPISP